jgi:hypothetical protein
VITTTKTPDRLISAQKNVPASSLGIAITSHYVNPKLTDNVDIK